MDINVADTNSHESEALNVCERFRIRRARGHGKL